MKPNESDHLEYKSKVGITFRIRADATRRDQSQMNIAMADSAVVENGRVIHTNVLRLFPWLIETFVAGWSGGEHKTGKEILNSLYAQPADPAEDLVMVLGSYILNHVKGLVSSPEDEAKKKGS